jgi:hypothetical protein
MSESHRIVGKRRLNSRRRSFTLTNLVKDDAALLFIALVAKCRRRSELGDLPARCAHLAR